MIKEFVKKRGKVLLAIVLSAIVCVEALPFSGFRAEAAGGSLSVDNFMISNGDFEAGRKSYSVRDWHVTSIELQSGKIAIREAEDYARNYKLQTAVEGENKVASFSKNGTGHAAMTSKEFSVVAEQGYRFSYNYKTTAIAKDDSYGVERPLNDGSDIWGVCVAVRQYDKDGNETSWTVIDPGTGKGKTVETVWNKATHDFVADEDAVTAELYFITGGRIDLKTTILFDNVSLKPFDACEVVNGDFEGITYIGDGGRADGLAGPAGWSLISSDKDQGYANITTGNQAGNKDNYSAVIVEENGRGKVMRLTTKSGRAMNATFADSSFIAVEAGQSYVVSYDVKYVPDADAYQHKSAGDVFVNDSVARITYYDADQNYLSHTYTNEVSDTSNLWERKTLSGTTPANVAFVKIGFSARGGWYLDNETFEIYIDNVSMNVNNATSIAGWSISGDEACKEYNSPNSSVNPNVGYYTMSYEGSKGKDGLGALSFKKKTTGWGYAELTSPQYEIESSNTYQVSYEYQMTGFSTATSHKGYVIHKPRTYVRYYDESGEQVGFERLDVNEAVEGIEWQAGTGNNATSDTTTSWEKRSFTFTPVEGAVGCDILLEPNSYDTIILFTTYFDNFRLNIAGPDESKDPAITHSALYEQRVLFVGDEIGSAMAQKASTLSEMIVTDACVQNAGFTSGLSTVITEQIEANLNDEYDYVVLSGGIQDAAASAPIGALTANNVFMGTDFDETTFAGALESTFALVGENFDGVKVAYVFPYQTPNCTVGKCADMSEYYNVAKAAAQKWNVSFIDLYSDNAFNSERLKVEETTYLPDAQLPNDEGATIIWNHVIEPLEVIDEYDSSLLGLTPEMILEKRFNRIVGDGVTPATDMRALKDILTEAQAEGMTDLEATVQNAFNEYEAYRVTICGATIAKDDANQLRMIAVSPTKALSEKVKVKKMGILVVPIEDITPGNKNYNKDADLSVGNEFVMNITSTYSKAGAAYDAILSGNKVDPAKEYAAIAYIIYEVDETEYVMYSQNDYVNAVGMQTASDGETVKSVYGIAKEMAELLVEEYKEQLNYDAIGGKNNISEIKSATEETEVSLFDVFNMVSDNAKWLNEILRVGGAF